MANDKLKFTGDVLAPVRALAGFKYAFDISRLTKSFDKYNGVLEKVPEFKYLFPFFEARHRNTNSIVEKLIREANGEIDVLDIPSGLSELGMVMSAQFPNMQYAEGDVGSMLKAKQEVAQKLIGARQNLRFFEADVLKNDEVNAARAHFTHGSSLIVVEGMFKHFKEEEIKSAISNLRSQAGKNTFLVTPDPNFNVANRDHLFKSVPNYAGVLRFMEQVAGESDSTHGFRDEEHAERLLVSGGFKIVDKVPWNLADSVYAQKIGLPRDYQEMTRKVIQDNCKTWILQPN